MTNKFNISDLLKDLDDPDDDDDFEVSDKSPFDSIPEQPSTKLADIVIAFRYLGWYRDLSIKSMEELSKRREAGDSFQFEQYIEDNIAKLPKMDIKMPNLDNILKSFGGTRK